MKNEVAKRLGKVFSAGLRLSEPLYSLHAIREKILAHGYFAFYDEDILFEFNRCAEIMDQLRCNMRSVRDTLDKQVKSEKSSLS